MTWSRDDAFVVYFNDTGGNPLENAIFTVSEPWAGATETSPGMYSIQINTEGPGNVGVYYLDIAISKENYATQQFKVNLTINPLPTSLNGSDATDFLYTTNVIDVYLSESELIYFEYIIADNATGVENALVSCSVNGVTGSFDDIDLADMGNGLYLLDYDTENLPEGLYNFEIKFEKANYAAKVASITLNMVKNTFVYDISEGNVVNDILKFTVENGQDQTITIDLRQIIDGQAALNASVQYNGIDFTHLGNGVYTYTIKSGEINTFIAKEIVEGVVTITQEYYEDVIFTVQVTVKMHALIPGVPTFYLAIGIALVVVGVGAIVLTKAVQNARIPEFVKKCDAVAKEISKKKTIDTRVSVVKSKEETLTDLFGKDWEDLGLDFRDTLGKSGKSKNIDTYKEEEF
jgi:hypothetical protein